MRRLRNKASDLTAGFPTILLAEKEDAFRDLVKIIITSGGYNVLTAKDGKEAMKLFSRFHSEISLVFSDVRLPKLGGEDLLKRMRQIDPHVRVLFAGTYLNHEMESDLLRAGAMACIEKPQGSKQILDKIQDILSG